MKYYMFKRKKEVLSHNVLHNRKRGPVYDIICTVKVRKILFFITITNLLRLVTDLEVI